MQVLERGERIELLVHKTDALQGQAFSFRRETRRLKNQMWCADCRQSDGLRSN
jgi:vesicle-associated membrane protein 7